MFRKNSIGEMKPLERSLKAPKEKEKEKDKDMDMEKDTEKEKALINRFYGVFMGKWYFDTALCGKYLSALNLIEKRGF